MRKLTFLLAFVFAGLLANAQNLLSNGDFETPAGFLSVTENGATVLQRVLNTQDATAQITFPTVGTAASVSAGVWVKKASGYDEQKAVVSTSDAHSGSTSINLQVNANATTALANVTTWSNQMIQQKLVAGLDVTQKYLLTFWARLDGGDANGANAATAVSVFITDGANKGYYSRAVLLTGSF